MSKDCKYCGKQIMWGDSEKSFLNMDGTKHDCRSQKTTDSNMPPLEAVIRSIVRDEIRRMKA